MAVVFHALALVLLLHLLQQLLQPPQVVRPVLLAGVLLELLELLGRALEVGIRGDLLVGQVAVALLERLDVRGLGLTSFNRHGRAPPSPAGGSAPRPAARTAA